MKVKLPKIWLMRQAGRYLPEYQKIKEEMGDFLTLCYTPHKAAEVTLQPLKRFNLSAAIVFSDILVVAQSLGLNLKFDNGIKLSRVISLDDCKNLTPRTEEFSYIAETISIVRSKLDKNKPLIGFAGSPWTVAHYILEGKSKSDCSFSKKTVFNKEKFLDYLIDILTEQTIIYLVKQIEAGADIIQIFDSWAGLLSGEYYKKYVINPTKAIVLYLRKYYPHIPIIGFPRNSGYLYHEYINEIDIDAISVDENIPLKIMSKWQKKLVVQGNLDPAILLTNKDVIANSVDNIFYNLDHNNFIFNLGHGVLPSTPTTNVEFLVNYVNDKFAIAKPNNLQ